MIDLGHLINGDVNIVYQELKRLANIKIKDLKNDLLHKVYNKLLVNDPYVYTEVTMDNDTKTYIPVLPTRDELLKNGISEEEADGIIEKINNNNVVESYDIWLKNLQKSNNNVMDNNESWLSNNRYE